MELKALGYVGVGAPNLDDWALFTTELLGMQCHDRTSRFAAFRMDERQQRLLIDSEFTAGRHYYGWEVENAEALDLLGARLQANNVAVKREPSSVAAQRCVRELISFNDPAGNRLEVFYGALKADTVFQPARALSGFRTGPLGLGHVVLTVNDVTPMLWFYQELLGFRLSDYMLSPFRAFFLHLNARHHSLAFIETGANGLHHIMMELLSLDDVGQAYDIALGEDDRVGVTLGRHSNDFMTSFYARTPSNFMIEYGWGGRSIEPGTWQAVEFFHGASLWGHERYWLPAEKRLQAREMRLKAAADGFRAPVQVVEGSYRIMTR